MLLNCIKIIPKIFNGDYRQCKVFFSTSLVFRTQFLNIVTSQMKTLPDENFPGWCLASIIADNFRLLLDIIEMLSRMLMKVYSDTATLCVLQ